PVVNQMSPVVTGNGSGFTAAWIESVQSRNTIVSQVASAAGEPIAGTGASIDQSYVQSMSIAHSPSETLVVWVADNSVFAERLSPSGMPLNTVVLTSKTFPSDVAVAWNGSRYFVVWSNGSQLFGAFIASDGGSSTTPRAFFGEPLVIGQPAPANLELTPDVVWDGRNFIIVFGEVPNLPCVLSACPSPSPSQGHFRVMRVSADGDAIDSSPPTISGTHDRAHVASGGAESLIALDSYRQLSTVTVHDDGGLTIDAETPLFRWFWYVSSAVAWDGAAYTVGWRYAGANTGPSWLGAAHVTRSGSPLDYRFVATGVASWSGRPSIAVNDAGITAFAISEAAGPSSPARARLYLASELAPMPDPPPAPRNVVSYFGGNTARIDWQQSSTPDAFVLESSFDFGTTWYTYNVISGDARTINVNAHAGNLFRVRAVGPGGMSEGTITSIGSMQRRHASH
ncbi:MAG TPA: hypothetical protein VHX14_01540, partial [Thermoanaerobaculia bacterium]|nr:hypothetical protein [Thermoanaerobaculia bacterium]